MLAVILSILKIIGIVLLIIVGIIVLLILAVLLVPIRYKGDASFDGDIDVKARVTWLFRVLHLELLFHKPKERDEADKGDKNLKYSLKLFGITLMASDKPEKKKKKKKKSKAKRKAQAKAKAAKAKAEAASAEANNKADTKSDAKEQEKPKSDDRLEIKVKPVSEPPKVNPALAKDSEGRTVITLDDKSKDKAKAGKNLSKAAKPKEKKKKRDIIGTIKKLWGLKDKIKEALKDPDNKATIAKVKKVVKRLARHLKPKVFKGYILFGMEDPCTTGKILGLASMFVPLIGGCIDLEGDFENKTLKGNLEFKGRIRLGVILVCFLKIYFDKNIKKLIKKAKKLIKK